MQESGEHGAACANCGAALGGEYCAQCGERRLHPGEHTLRHIVGEWFEAFSHGEGRLLVSLRTLLLRPGELTREYFRGRRVPYTKPVALFFAINLLYFLLTTVNTFGTPMYLQLEIQPLVQAKQVVATKQVFAARLEPTERAAVLDEYLGMFAAIKAKIESGSLPRSGKEAEEQRMIAASRRAPALEALHRYEQRFDERTETLSRALVIALIPMLACFLWLTLAPLRRGLPELLIFATHLLGGLLLILLISGWLITATTLAATMAHRGLLAHLRAGRRGVVLAPARGADEMFGTALDDATAPGPQPPGRGVLVAEGTVLPVQLAAPPDGTAALMDDATVALEGRSASAPGPRAAGT